MEQPTTPTTAGPGPLAAPTAPGPQNPPAAAPAPETDLWAGRTSSRHYIGRIALWFLGNVAAGVLVGWIAGRWDALGARGATWMIVAIVLVTALLFLSPIALHILGRRYRLTTQRLFIETGILSRTTDQTELIRVDDVRVHQTFFDRVFGLGSVLLLSTDVTNREVTIDGIVGPHAVAESVRAHMRAQRGRALYVENL